MVDFKYIYTTNMIDCTLGEECYPLQTLRQLPTSAENANSRLCTAMIQDVYKETHDRSREAGQHDQKDHHKKQGIFINLPILIS